MTKANKAIVLLAADAFAFLLAVFALGHLLTVPAKGHSFYSSYCCDGKDCAPIKTRFVKAVAGGYLVTLRPEDHIALRDADGPREYLVPYANAKPSPDGDYHACILPFQPDVMRCLYAPPPGS